MNINDSMKRLCNGLGLHPYKSISKHKPTIADLHRSDMIVTSSFNKWYDVWF